MRRTIQHHHHARVLPDNPTNILTLVVYHVHDVGAVHYVGDKPDHYHLTEGHYHIPDNFNLAAICLSDKCAYHQLDGHHGPVPDVDYGIGDGGGDKLPDTDDATVHG